MLTFTTDIPVVLLIKQPWYSETHNMLVLGILRYSPQYTYCTFHRCRKQECSLVHPNKIHIKAVHLCWKSSSYSSSLDCKHLHCCVFELLHIAASTSVKLAIYIHVPATGLLTSAYIVVMASVFEISCHIVFVARACTHQRLCIYTPWSI